MKLDSMTVATSKEPHLIHDPPLDLDLDSAKHPLRAVLRIAEINHLDPNEARLVFRALQVEPGDYGGDAPPKGYREKGEFKILVRDLENGKLAARIREEVAAGNDVVFTNIIKTYGSYLYIPMIDFKASRLHLHAEVLKRHGLDLTEFDFFKTGRSYHAYGPRLVGGDTYLAFMGHLLLNEDEIIDTRWIGHCLVRGFASLRWTCTSAHYGQVPELVEPPFKK